MPAQTVQGCAATWTTAYSTGPVPGCRSASIRFRSDRSSAALTLRACTQVIQQLLACAEATDSTTPAPPAVILDNYDLRPADAAAIAAAARINRSVRLLSLSSNPAVGDAGASSVCAALKRDGQVETQRSDYYRVKN
jgi:hypothetical protein